MRRNRLFALLLMWVLTLTLTGCEAVPEGTVDAAREKLMEITGLNLVREELAKLQNVTIGDLSMFDDIGSKGTVSLGDGASAQSGDRANDATQDTNSNSGKSEGSSGQTSSGQSVAQSLNNFYCEIYYGSKALDEYGYSPQLLANVWYKDGKLKTVDSVENYYTASSNEFFETFMRSTSPARAEEIMSDSAFSKQGTKKINEFVCTEYKSDVLTSQTEYLSMGTSGMYSGGYERYFIYTGGQMPVIMAYVVKADSGGSSEVTYDPVTGTNVTESTEGFFSIGEYHYSFETVTEADVAPPDGMTSTKLE